MAQAAQSEPLQSETWGCGAELEGQRCGERLGEREPHSPQARAQRGRGRLDLLRLLQGLLILFLEKEATGCFACFILFKSILCSFFPSD